MEIMTIETPNGIGYLVTYNIPNYGITQPYLYDGRISYAKERRTSSMMPKEFAFKFGKNFDWSYYQEDVTIQKRLVNSFVSKYDGYRNTGRGLYIYSKTKGSGKTLLACCLANEIMERYNAVVKFCSVIDYLDLIKDKSAEAKETIDSLKKCGLLIFDDIGVQTEKQEWISNSLLSLIDYRCRNNHPIIYTSNLEIEKASSDDRVQSRIYGCSIPICIPETPVRKILADKNNTEFIKEILQN